METDSKQIANPAIEAAYQQHSAALLRFLKGILKNEAAAADALQWTFVQLLEKGQVVSIESLKSWLYRVAFNAAMNQRRRSALENRSVEQIAIWRQRSGRSPTDEQPSSWVDSELQETLRTAIEQLPAAQQQIVIARIVHEKKFAEIASELDLPLGTVLTRMRTALAKLKQLLNREPI